MADHARVTRSNLLASTGLTAPLRVSRVSYYAMVTEGENFVHDVTKADLIVHKAVTDPIPIHDVTTSKILSQVGFHEPVRATITYVYALVSINRMIRPLFVDSESETYPHQWGAQLRAIEVPEINPYRPDIPDEFEEIGQDRVFYDFQREVQETLRKQHNFLQAGDTTYHWSVLTKVTVQKDFTLGSLGRFYHEDYGIIIARYVQFERMTGNMWLGAPCGRLEKKESFEWVVTDDYERSHPDWVSGFIAAWEPPNNGEYGWIIVSGANLYPIKVIPPDTIPQKDDALVWVGTSMIGLNAEGRILGRVVYDEHEHGLIEGTVFINIEGFTDEYYVDLIDEHLAPTFAGIDLRLDSAELRLGVVEAATGVSSTLFNEINQRLDLLHGQINTERMARRSEDELIRDALGQFPDFNVFEENIVRAFGEADEQLSMRITNCETRITALEQQGPGVDSSAQISALLEIVAGLSVQMVDAAKIYAPMVTGDSPPIFIHNPDGSLILAEVEF